MLKILALSDLHGILPKITIEFDLMVICGDVCPVYNHGTILQKNWLNHEYVDWIKSLPYKDEHSKAVMVFGNHDFYGEKMDDTDILELIEKTGNRLEILQHNPYTFTNNEGSISIFGTPYCRIFGRWAYMINDEALDTKFSEIPEDLDILISHDSPKTNKLGAILDGRWYNENTGNHVLSKHIDRVKPKLFFSGHFHSGNHNFEKIGETWMANVSIVDENYEYTYRLLYVDYDVEKREVLGFDYI